MGDPRVLLGKKSSEYGLWVSKVGDDITNPQHPLIFDSSKAEGSSIIKSGTITAGTTGTTANTIYYSDYVNYTDGSDLNYIPLVLVWNDAYNFPIRRARRLVVIEGSGRGSTTHFHQFDANGLYVEALINKFRIASKYFGTSGINIHWASDTFRYAVLAIGGSTITSVGPT